MRNITKYAGRAALYDEMMNLINLTNFIREIMVTISKRTIFAKKEEESVEFITRYRSTEYRSICSIVYVKLFDT